MNDLTLKTKHGRVFFWHVMRWRSRMCLALLLAVTVGCTGSITPVGQSETSVSKDAGQSESIAKAKGGSTSVGAEPNNRPSEDSILGSARTDTVDVDEDVDAMKPAAAADDASRASVSVEPADAITAGGESPSEGVSAQAANNEPEELASDLSTEPVGVVPAGSTINQQVASAAPNVDREVAAKKFVVPPLPPLRDGKREVTFDTIKFDMEKDDPFDRSLLTTTVEQLEGTRIRIRGYILPSFQQRGITQFVLVRDNMECCFGPGAALFDCIVVEMAPGKSAEFTTRPVAVEGVFSLNELTYPDDETRHLAIYHMVADKVQ